MADSPAAVPLNQSMQRGQQTGRAGSHHAARKQDLAAITETWWDVSHDLTVAIDGYRLFRRDRRGRRGGGVTLYFKKWTDCEELSLKRSHEQVESL